MFQNGIFPYLDRCNTIMNRLRNGIERAVVCHNLEHIVGHRKGSGNWVWPVCVRIQKLVDIHLDFKISMLVQITHQLFSFIFLALSYFLNYEIQRAELLGTHWSCSVTEVHMIYLYFCSSIFP